MPLEGGSNAEILFPFEHVRPIQKDMMEKVKECLRDKKVLIAHAPTGLGKTIAALAPAIPFALKHNLRIFFLTSRHTQHHLCVETLRSIKKKFGIELNAVDLIGKQQMCLQGVDGLPSSDFLEFCKKSVAARQCEYYENTRQENGKPTLAAEQLVSTFSALGPRHSEELIHSCKGASLCPYYTAELLSKKANVIIGDYFHLLHPPIREAFLKKLETDISRCIIIFDEAHNVPQRARDLLSTSLSLFMVDRALAEAGKFGWDKAAEMLSAIKTVVGECIDGMEAGQELLDKDALSGGLEKYHPYETYIETLDEAAEDIRERQRLSFCGSIASFLGAWKGQDHGFSRILQRFEASNGVSWELRYDCLDPTLVTKEILGSAYAVICMSGTLLPTEMYADLLGCESPIQVHYPSPFPKENRLTLIIPETTTKFLKRSREEYEKIGKKAAQLIDIIPGNVLLFFPSYELRSQVYPYLREHAKKQLLIEKQGMTKQEKLALLGDFKKLKSTGSALVAVASGSFGEGIDLPDDQLNGVIVVGVPLEKPTLMVKELIEYYDFKFGKGLDYGYFLPAMIRVMQNAGRCIRSPTDRGVIVFLDERYADPRYRDLFPDDFITEDPSGGNGGNWKQSISEFFSGK